MAWIGTRPWLTTDKIHLMMARGLPGLLELSSAITRCLALQLYHLVPEIPIPNVAASQGLPVDLQVKSFSFNR